MTMQTFDWSTATQHDFSEEELKIAADCRQEMLTYYLNQDLKRRQLFDEASELDRKRGWSKPPNTADEARAFYEEGLAHEREYYAHVRIYETNSPHGFYLTYAVDASNKSDSRTGPFKSLDAAKSWYIKGGR